MSYKNHLFTKFIPKYGYITFSLNINTRCEESFLPLMLLLYSDIRTKSLMISDCPQSPETRRYYHFGPIGLSLQTRRYYHFGPIALCLQRHGGATTLVLLPSVSRDTEVLPLWSDFPQSPETRRYYHFGPIVLSLQRHGGTTTLVRLPSVSRDTEVLPLV